MASRLHYSRRTTFHQPFLENVSPILSGNWRFASVYPRGIPVPVQTMCTEYGLLFLFRPRSNQFLILR